MSKFFLVLVSLFALNVHAGDPRTSSPFSYSVFKDSITRPEKKHSPQKATIYSLVLPGLGQAYNRKYWKIPVIYAALGISGWSILDNRKNMREHQDALKLMLDNDSTTNAPPGLAVFSVDVLRATRNLYRTNRDYSIIAFAGFYLLNVVDAAIDAHFYNFNIDKPLAMQKHKHWHIYASQIGRTQGVGLAWTF